LRQDSSTRFLPLIKGEARRGLESFGQPSRCPSLYTGGELFFNILHIHSDDGSTLLAQKFQQIIRTKRSRTCGTGCFPTAEWIDAGPCTGCCSATAIHISDSGFNAIQEFSNLACVIAEDARC